MARCRVLDTLQEALAVHAFYFFLVNNFGNPLALLITLWCAFHPPRVLILLRLEITGRSLPVSPRLVTQGQ